MFVDFHVGCDQHHVGGHMPGIENIDTGTFEGALSKLQSSQSAAVQLYMSGGRGRVTQPHNKEAGLGLEGSCSVKLNLK